MQRQRSILCGLIVVLSLAGCTAREPRAAEAPTVYVVETATVVPSPIVVKTIEGEPRCYAECIGGLYILLDGAVPQEFALELTTEAGPVGRVRCVDGQVTECWAYGRDDYGYCSGFFLCYTTAGHQAVGWMRDEPHNFDVTVTWDGNQIVEHIEPKYREVVDCLGQTCYDAGVTITLPESP